MSKRSSKRLTRRNTNDVRSRESGASKVKNAQNIYFPQKRNSSVNDSQGSKSPEVKRVMESLTHHRVKIDEKTKLLINGSEVLTSKGIKGNIHKVGVGFGTGRHTSGRRLDLLKEVPQASASMEMPPPPEPEKRVQSQSPVR